MMHSFHLFEETSLELDSFPSMPTTYNLLEVDSAKVNAESSYQTIIVTAWHKKRAAVLLIAQAEDPYIRELFGSSLYNFHVTT